MKIAHFGHLLAKVLTYTFQAWIQLATDWANGASKRNSTPHNDVSIGKWLSFSQILRLGTNSGGRLFCGCLAVRWLGICLSLPVSCMYPRSATPSIWQA